MKNIVLALSIIIGQFFVMNLNAKEHIIFVSQKGNDKNIGTIQYPLKTLEGAKIKIREFKHSNPGEDIKVLIRGGYYQLEQTFDIGLDDGTNGNSTITYCAYPGERAIIGSGVIVSDWKLTDSNLLFLPEVAKGHVYEAKIPDGIYDFFSMYDNGIRLPRAVSKGVETPLPHVEDQSKIDKKTLHELVCPPGLLRAWENPNDIEAFVIPNQPWVMNILKLASVDTVSNTAITMLPATYPMRKVWEYRRINPNLWLENAIDFLDEPGEWVVNTQLRKIWYWPQSGIPGNDIRIPKLGTLIKVAGKTDKKGPVDIPVKGIVFKDLTFMHADRGLWKDNDKGIQHDWEMEDKENALIRFRGAEDCKVINCEFTNSGGNAIRLDYHCQNIEITGNEINNLGQAAINCIGYGAGTKDVNKNNRITNNHIHHNGQIYWHSQMIFLWQSGNNYVANNFIHDVPRKAIGISGPRLGHFRSKISKAPREYWKTTRWWEVKETGLDHEFYLPFLHSRNNLIENNEIRNPAFILGDGAAINISGSGKGNVVRHNLIYDMNNTNSPSAIRTDDSQTGSTYEDNIIFRSNVTGTQSKGENIYRNNYFINLATEYKVPWAAIFGNTEGYAKKDSYGKSVWTHNVFYTESPTANRKFYGAENAGEEFKDVTWDYNVCYMKGVKLEEEEYTKNLRVGNKEIHSIYDQDPGFKDLSNWDFSVPKNSPLIKAGVKPLTLDGIGLTDDFPTRFNADKGYRGEIGNKLDWWQDAKFGMFIHWGLYSQTAGYWKGKPAKGAEHFMIHEKISLAEYSKIADQFNPTEFDAEEWVLLAKNAGMKYIVITTKHHEGFAMYNSKSNDYNIVKRTPYGKDPMKELAAACQKHNMKLGFYYSLGRDWEDPDTPTNWPTKGGRSNLVDFPDEDSKVFNRYFERKVKPQLREILSQYGLVAVLWFDTPEGISKAESMELRKLIEELQPNCIINNRIGNNLGDFGTPEQEIGERNLSKPWETCITMSQNWGYVEYDTLYKSPEVQVRILTEIVSNGGNLLLNVAPTGKGKITDAAVSRLNAIGKWMDINQEGIYDTRPWDISYEMLTDEEPGIQKEVEIKPNEKSNMVDAVKDATNKEIFPVVRFTKKERDLFAFVCSYHQKDVTIKSLGLEVNNKIKEVITLGVDTKVKWKQTKEGLKIKMPDYPIEEVPVLGLKITY